MKKIIITDITGRTQLYDEMLFSSLREILNEEIRLLIPGHGLISFVPQKYQSSSHSFKRIIKILECLINYLLIGFRLFFSRTNILHMQWLPFMEIIGVEYYILLFYKRLSPKLRIILTVHNVYPHDLKDEKKALYKKRFLKACRLLDAFIVHTSTSKYELSSDFNVDKDIIFVCPHGVFKPLTKKASIVDHEESGILRILMFGIHSYYKGTDILVGAINMLPDKYLKMVDVHITGLIDKDYFKGIKNDDNSNVIEWKNYFLSDEELADEISRCDMIVLPYRKISQSGVLLMALNCSKVIICSDLPSFKETLHGSNDDNSFDQDLFFRSGDPGSLCSLLEKYIDKKVAKKDILRRMDELAKEYTWDRSAEKTVEVYRRNQL